MLLLQLVGRQTPVRGGEQTRALTFSLRGARFRISEFSSPSAKRVNPNEIHSFSAHCPLTISFPFMSWSKPAVTRGRPPGPDVGGRAGVVGGVGPPVVGGDAEGGRSDGGLTVGIAGLVGRVTEGGGATPASRHSLGLGLRPRPRRFRPFAVHVTKIKVRTYVLPPPLRGSTTSMRRSSPS